MASIAMKQLRSRASASGWALLLAALLVAGWSGGGRRGRGRAPNRGALEPRGSGLRR